MEKIHRNRRATVGSLFSGWLSRRDDDSKFVNYSGKRAQSSSSSCYCSIRGCSDLLDKFLSHGDDGSIEKLTKLVFCVSIAVIFAMPGVVNHNKAIINSWRRSVMFWMEVALMEAAFASLVALLINARKRKFASFCGCIAILSLAVALVLLQSVLFF